MFWMNFLDDLMMNMFIFLNFLMIIFMIIPTNYYTFHPLLMVLMLVFFTIIMCIKINYLFNNFWYSYILFLVMIGGLIILFMYFTSLINNQLFYFKKKKIMYMILKFLNLFVMYMMFMFMKSLIYMDFELINLNNYLKFTELDMFKNMFMDYTFDLMIYMMLYLFLVMICSVMICTKVMIPLRQINKLN
nr:NADH dehydrogenase subunit 6 [Psyttalia incisi]